MELGDYEIAGSGRMSGIYLSMGDYDTAWKYSNEGLQYFEKEERHSLVAGMLTTISIINIERRKFDKAVMDLERALLIRKDKKEDAD